MTGLTRRNFLQYSVALPLGLGITQCAQADSESVSEWIIGCCDHGEKHLAAWVKRGDHGVPELHHVELPSRGHGIAAHPRYNDQLLFFARRPGRYFCVVSRTHDEEPRFISLPEQRVINGHGCFSSDGRWLMTSENDYERGKGVIGVWDSSDYRRVDEIELNAIGPHEIKMMPDGQQMVVAVGGILTHPQQGRKKLNLDHMEPGVAMVDWERRRVERFELGLDRQASLRHLDVTKQGQVLIGIQFERQAVQQPQALIATWDGQGLRYLQQAGFGHDLMNDYVGSVAVAHAHNLLITTSPRGNCATFWDLDREQFVGYHPMRDVCGVAMSSDEQHAILTNSNGEIRTINLATRQEQRAKRIRLPGIRWDNHLLVHVV